MRGLIFASVFALAGFSRAAEEVSPVASATLPPDGSKEPVAKLNATRPKAPHEVSAATAAKLAAAASTFVAIPEPSPAQPAVAPEISPVARDTEKPKNQIVHLPNYIVGEPRPHIPESELEVLTPKGRAAYAFNRRPGLRFGPFAALNTPIALDMLEDDLQAQRRAEEADLLSLYAVKEAKPTSSMNAPAQVVKGP